MITVYGIETKDTENGRKHKRRKDEEIRNNLPVE